MITRHLTKNFYINTIIVFLIFILDRFSKIYVVYLDKVNYSSELYQSKYLNITLVWNEGIAFGLFSFDQNHLYNLLTLIISIIVFIVFIMMIKSDGLKKYSLIMIFGGALGNLYDRIFFKAVPDFIDLHVENFHWFIFNIADIFITFGVIMLILWEILPLNRNYEKK